MAPTNNLPSTDMRKRFQSSSALRVGFCAALVALCAFGILGQSGRRVRKSTPAPVSTPEPTPSPTTPAQKPKPVFTFILGMDRYGEFSRIPLYVSSGVLRTCAARLDDPESVAAEIAPNDMTRADAVRRAQAEKEAHVVWLKLRPNNLSGQADPREDPYDVDIEYAVFAPITGKQVTSGRTFPAAYRKRGVITRPTTGTQGDYYLNQAAKAAAERILDHFHVRGRRP